MRVYLDDDLASALLARLLDQAGHQVQRPADVNMIGQADVVHFTYAIRQKHVVLSGNQCGPDGSILRIESLAIIPMTGDSQ